MMNEALCSILCAEDEWHFDSEGRSIKFNKDGTGELWCRCNFNYWIAANIQWKSIKPLGHDESPVQNAGSATSAPSKSPRLLGQLTLEITLLKGLPQRAQDSVLSKSTMVNEHSLTDDAFRPKIFTISIEKGNFKEPCYMGQNDPGTRYELRLLFNKSPYAPQSEWKKPEGGPDEGQFWNHREFVGRISSELKKQGEAMNDVPAAGWNSCVVS